MITATIELWNANKNGARTTLRQVVISNMGKAGDVAENTYIYEALVLEPDVRVPQTGPRRAEIPQARVDVRVTFRHDQDDTELELIFRAFRELRQAHPELFERPDKHAVAAQIKQARLRTVFG